MPAACCISLVMPAACCSLCFLIVFLTIHISGSNEIWLGIVYIAASGPLGSKFILIIGDGGSWPGLDIIGIKVF